MFKRFVLAFCVVLLITILVGCSNSSTNEINNTTPTKKETVNFDLSQYKDHGELSEGLLWVIKETSSWDSEPYESYAYLDVDGNVVYGWFSVGKYFKNDGYVGYVRATKLQDFKNGFALIYNDSGVDKLGGYVNATVIDTSGNEIANFLIDAYKGSTGTKMDYKDFSSQGYAFFIGKEFYDGEKGMFFVNKTGVHMFRCNENSYISGATLENIDVINNKYLYVSWGAQLFNSFGKLVLDIGESSGINPTSIDIINDKYIECSFEGKDSKDYICVIDFDGNFIKSPVLQSEYTRAPEEWIVENPPKQTSYAAYEAAAIGSAVAVECYVQAIQSWWDNKVTVYAQDQDGAYFIHEMACSKEDAAKLTAGTNICVFGIKSVWNGAIQITDGTFEFADGEDTFIAEPMDATALLSTEDLIKHQNKKVFFKGLTIKKIEYKNGKPGDDIYVTVADSKGEYNFCVECYLTNPNTKVYKAFADLKEGNVVDMEGFLYWCDGVNTHITAVAKVA